MSCKPFQCSGYVYVKCFISQKVKSSEYIAEAKLEKKNVGFGNLYRVGAMHGEAQVML